MKRVLPRPRLGAKWSVYCQAFCWNLRKMEGAQSNSSLQRSFSLFKIATVHFEDVAQRGRGTKTFLWLAYLGTLLSLAPAFKISRRRGGYFLRKIIRTQGTSFPSLEMPPHRPEVKEKSGRSPRCAMTIIFLHFLECNDFFPARMGEKFHRALSFWVSFFFTCPPPPASPESVLVLFGRRNLLLSPYLASVNSLAPSREYPRTQI